jgi:protocatechuate 3,4-dioxygenase beta subunit
MVTRRNLLRMAVALPAAFFAWRRLAGASGQGLGQFTTPTLPCKDDKPTPAAADDTTFKAKSPERGALVEKGMTGQTLVLTGSLRGLVCGPIKGAVLDFWQADAQGVYDKTGFRLRGHQLTDANGRYRLETIVPGPYAKRAPHINVRVQAPGKPLLKTQLFFPDDPLTARDAVFRAELAMKVTKTATDLTATFDFVLDA